MIDQLASLVGGPLSAEFLDIFVRILEQESVLFVLRKKTALHEPLLALLGCVAFMLRPFSSTVSQCSNPYQKMCRPK